MIGFQRVVRPALVIISLAVSGPVAAGPRAAKPPPLRFEVTTSKLKQVLTAVPKGKKAISFELTRSGGCARTTSGVARLKGGDYESAEDENGVAYLADEYRHTAKNGCELVIWIKAKDATRATVLEVDCEAKCAPVEDLMFRTDATDKSARP